MLGGIWMNQRESMSESATQLCGDGSWMGVNEEKSHQPSDDDTNTLDRLKNFI